MKETGIMMSGDHPKLVLDGIKTQTRRTKGLNNINAYPENWTVDLQGDIAAFRHKVTGVDILIRCPYGQVGDRLWVRETWWQDSEGDIYYKADWQTNPRNGSWKPSIHMFRKDSRITLEVTEVRVERVQEIKATDALKEGVKLKKPYIYADLKVLADFNVLWDSLNAKRGFGWESNPWLWAISFKKEEK